MYSLNTLAREAKVSFLYPNRKDYDDIIFDRKFDKESKKPIKNQTRPKT